MGMVRAALKFTGLIVVLTVVGMIIEGDVESIKQSVSALNELVAGIASLGEMTLSLVAVAIFLGVLYFVDDL